MKKNKLFLLASECLALLSGCSASEMVNMNIRGQANNFSVYRKFTAVNLRNNYYLLTIEGYLSIDTDSENDVNVTVRTGEDTYQLHYVHMNSEWTSYMVEQLDDTHTDPYHYEIHWFGIVPEFKGGVENYNA